MGIDTWAPIAAERMPVYGECGGYMVLGETLTDAAGVIAKLSVR